jgi:endonuclease/exonuclease/phosphatase family metal-dependent hydrolase
VVLAGLDARAVVAGDLNEGPGDAAYDRIAALHPAVSAGVATYPAHRPTVALDAIFAGRDLRVVSTAAVDVDERDLATGSDHRPVWVDLDLAGTGPRQLGRS